MDDLERAVWVENDGELSKELNKSGMTVDKFVSANRVLIDSVINRSTSSTHDVCLESGRGVRK